MAWQGGRPLWAQPCRRAIQRPANCQEDKRKAARISQLSQLGRRFCWGSIKQPWPERSIMTARGWGFRAIRRLQGSTLDPGDSQRNLKILILLEQLRPIFSCHRRSGRNHNRRQLVLEQVLQHNPLSPRSSLICFGHLQPLHLSSYPSNWVSVLALLVIVHALAATV